MVQEVLKTYEIYTVSAPADNNHAEAQNITDPSVKLNYRLH